MNAVEVMERGGVAGTSQAGCCKTKCCPAPCLQMPMLATGTVALVTLVAGAVIQDWRVLLASGVCTAATWVLGDRGVAYYKPYHDFEENVEDFGEVVKEDLTPQVENLSKNVEVLTQERDTLQKTLNAASALLGRYKQELDADQEEEKDIIERISHTYGLFKNALEAQRKDNEELKKCIAAFAAKMHILDDTDDKFADGAKKLDRFKQDMTPLLEKFGKLIAELEDADSSAGGKAFAEGLKEKEEDSSTKVPPLSTHSGKPPRAENNE